MLDEPAVRVYAGNGGALMWNQGYKVTFQESFELHDFPFDRQDLTMEMRLDDTRTWDVFDMRVHSVMFYKMALQHDEWKMCIPTVDYASHKSTNVAMQVIRRPGYYIRNIVSIVVMVSAFALLSFAIEITDIADRINTIITLLLTTVAFKFVIGDTLPRVNYNTKLDEFMFLNMFFLFFVGAMSVAGCLAFEWYDVKINRLLFWVSLGVKLICTLGWAVNARGTMTQQAKRAGKPLHTTPGKTGTSADTKHTKASTGGRT